MSFSRPSALPAHIIQRSLLVAVVVFCLAPGIVSAEGAISQGFTLGSNDPAPAGTVVSLASATENTATPATSDNAEQLLGVIGSTSILELGSGKQVQVVVSGLTSALVSDINGTVKSGDKITASPIKGVGMKATGASEIVGTAQADLAKNTHSSDQTVTDKSGKKQTVKVGLIPVQVDVTYYATSADKLSTIVPPLFLSLATEVAGKDVSPLRVLAGLFALILGFVTVAIMLQAAIRSGLIAIGRNPLAQGALRKGLLEVIATATAILALTIVATYLVLSL